MEFNCKWCGKSFSSKSNLYTHTKTAKYCLKKRAENVENELSTCDICGKNFSQVVSLKKHHQKCTLVHQGTIHKLNNNLSTKDETIKELIQKNDNLLILIKKYKRNKLAQKKKFEDEIEKLKAENLMHIDCIKTQKEDIDRLRNELNYEQGILAGYTASKPSIIVNNTQIINNKLKTVPTSRINPFTPELIESSSENYTYEHFLEMRNGLITHLLETTIFEDEDGRIHKNYVCTNRARNTFHILISSDKWKKDNGAFYIHRYLDSLRSLAEDYNAQFNKCFNEISYGDDTMLITQYKNMSIALLTFMSAFREGPCESNREKLLLAIRSGVKDRLSI